MRHWLITDTHFNHEKVKEYCGRPDDFEFKIENGLKLILPEDVLIHLGDICIGDDENVHKKYIKPLKCKKWLVRGNHDRKSDGWYLANGWDAVSHGIFLDRFGKKIYLSHMPFPIQPPFDVNIHGHLHNTGHREGINDGKHINLAIENTNYQPVLLENMLTTCTIHVNT